MEKIKKLILKIKYFTNYLYYLNSSVVRNSYPCKLMGEKINLLHAEKIVSYKILGQQGIQEIPLHALLSNINLIGGFHPIDALKLGHMAFESVILESHESERKEKFIKIKNIMLNSTHDIYPNIELEKLDLKYEYSDSIINMPDYITSALMENIYPCKLVRGKHRSSTTITFTILGKRDGHEKLLHDLIEDKDLLEKFHPTEAIKFGFIASGDIIFSLPETKSKQKIKQLKIDMLNA